MKRLLPIVCFVFVSISAVFAQGVTPGDNCNNAIESPDLMVVTDCSKKDEVVRVQGSLKDATPNPDVEGCDFSETPTVWFKTSIEAAANGIRVFMDAKDDWNPKIAVFAGEGTDGCSSLKLLTGQGGSCGFSAGNLASIVVETEDLGISDIWIAVSGDRATEDKKLNFDLALMAVENCTFCTLKEDDFCFKRDMTITVEDRSGNGDDMTKFSPGEKVKLCLDAKINASQVNIDWLQGLIPRFGKGWDMSSFSPESASVHPNGAEWVNAEEDCAPVSRADLPGLRTYVTKDGLLSYCHAYCEPCHYATPVSVDQKMPSGWYYRSAAGNASCEANSCNPNNNWGLQGSNGITDVKICLELTVKAAPTDEEKNDLSISLLPTTDAVTGCWDNKIKCASDPIYIGATSWQVSTPTSTEEATASYKISPNPTDHSVRIHGIGNTQYMLYSVDGRLLEDNTYSDRIDLSRFDSGIYLLKLVHNGKESTVEKIIKR